MDFDKNKEKIVDENFPFFSENNNQTIFKECYFQFKE
jgi:hypothetical protein